LFAVLGLIVILKSALAFCGVGVLESVTCTVKLEVSAVVGTPEITAPLKARPAGKVPAVIAQV
jgi:hypothetical protein